MYEFPFRYKKKWLLLLPRWLLFLQLLLFLFVAIVVFLVVVAIEVSVVLLFVCYISVYPANQFMHHFLDLCYPTL